MISDDERREVAKNIRRGFDICSDTVGWFWLSGSLFGMSVLARSEETIRSGINRIADLIEPEPERTCRVKPVGNSYMCLACRALTDKGAVSGISSSFCVNYCPNCGAKIVGVKLVGE